MHDPFPLRAPDFLRDLVAPWASRLSLPTLPLHIHEVLLAFLFYHYINVSLSPRLSRALFPHIYPRFPARTRVNWDVHVVSLVQSTLINVVALAVMWTDKERAGMATWQDRVWGYTGACGLVQALAMGYFLWDLWVSLKYLDIFGLGLLAHAVSALGVYSLGYRPFINYYSTTFILYELSSPFLNIHWFCDKLNLTGSRIQLYNGYCLLLSFFGSRLVWGVWQSVAVFRDIFQAVQHGPPSAEDVAGWRAAAAVFEGSPASEVWAFDPHPIPLWLAMVYLGSNVLLNGLNVYWFSKMIGTVRKRFPPPFGTQTPAEAAQARKAAQRQARKEKLQQQRARTGSGKIAADSLVEGVDVETDGEVDEEGEKDLRTFQYAAAEDPELESEEEEVEVLGEVIDYVVPDYSRKAAAAAHAGGTLPIDSMGRSVLGDGYKGVEVQRVEVKRRRAFRA